MFSPQFYIMYCTLLIITHNSEVIIFFYLVCVFVCVCIRATQTISCSYKDGICSCASYVPCIHDVIGDVARPGSRYIFLNCHDSVFIIQCGNNSMFHGIYFWCTQVLGSVWKILRGQKFKPFSWIFKIYVLCMKASIWRQTRWWQIMSNDCNSINFWGVLRWNKNRN